MDYRDCHAFFNLSPRNSLYNLMVSPSLLSKEQLDKLSNILSDKICFLNRDSGRIVISLMDTLFYLRKSEQPFNPLLIRNVCDNLIELFLSFYGQQSASEPVKKSEIQSSLEYINTHFKEKISLQNVAEHAGYNPAHFSKLFHKKMGVTFNHYVSSLRINYAKRLLASTEHSISFICFECGFSSSSSFNRSFSSIVGVSPSEYRIERQQ